MVNNQKDLVTGELVFLTSKMTKMSILNEIKDTHFADCPTSWNDNTAASALKHCLRETYLDGGSTMIRKAKGSRTFIVVNEETNEVDNNYKSEQIFRTSDCGIVTELKNNLTWEEDEGDWTRRVKEVMACSMGRRITSSLYVMMQRAFFATRVHRGAYFIPASKLEAWGKFCDDWHDKTECTIERIQSGCDENTVKAVTASATNELADRYKSVQEEIKKVDERLCTTEWQHEAKDKKKKALHAELKSIETICEALDKSFQSSTTTISKIKGSVDIDAALSLL